MDQYPGFGSWSPGDSWPSASANWWQSGTQDPFVDHGNWGLSGQHHQTANVMGTGAWPIGQAVPQNMRCASQSRDDAGKQAFRPTPSDLKTVFTNAMTGMLLVQMGDASQGQVSAKASLHLQMVQVLLEIQPDALLRVKPKGWIMELAINPNLEAVKWTCSQLSDLSGIELVYWRAVSAKQFDTAGFIRGVMVDNWSGQHDRLAFYISAHAGSIDSLQWLLQTPSNPPTVTAGFRPSNVDWTIAGMLAALNEKGDCLNFILTRVDDRKSKLLIFKSALMLGNLEMIRYINEKVGVRPDELSIPTQFLATKEVVKWLINDLGVDRHSDIQTMLTYGQPDAVRWLINRSRYNLSRKSIQEIGRQFGAPLTVEEQSRMCVICGEDADRWCVVKCCKQAFCIKCLEECWTSFATCTHCRNPEKKLEAVCIKK